ncbi:ABC transporter substrate-binding protein [Roseiflexus castenholzii]|jgi:multiple sugar transport system substrate-binding protein|uniref:Extracellular solute-binding protein family 1 n=1 Tax=Roseiflexus castenholzii (strain DSM 13941 / HLO8) TaxID=383372 RepID=A7NM70_ROSCS|nr:sugar ABC transporter substrate-binding protein [Roseiflexus castenholzii]ABU58625.1 extracellular solute-binding protein family 1 [Roseiflexus castenholzii DSM 13941]
MTTHHEEELAQELKRRGLSRREILQIGARLGLSSAAVAAVLAACGQAPQQSGTGAAPTTPPATEPTPTSLYDLEEGNSGWPTNAIADPSERVEISVAHAWDAVFFERQKQFDTLFMQRHPNIVVKAENTPFGEYRQKYVAQAAGNALPDIMYCQFSWAQEFIKNGLFRPLDDYIAKEKDFNLQDFTPQSLVSYQRDGKLWGIPYDEGPANLYYNKDIFDAAGIPYPDETWDLEKLKEVALKLTQGEGPNKIFGLGELPSLGDSLVAPPYLMPFGAQYLREPKEDECLINQPEAVAALEWWQELRDKGAVPSPADLQNVAWPAFQFGKIAMTMQGSWATPPIRAGAKFNWDIAMWPKGPKAHVTFSAGSAYMITRDSKNPDAAWIYLNEYLSTAGQSYMWGITGRGSPARLSAWPSYLNSKFAPPGAKYVEQAMRTIASHDIIDQPTGPQVTQAAGPIWDLVVAGQLSVKEACDQVFAAVDPIIAVNRA